MMNDATNYAKSQADLFKQSLQYLVDAQNQQKLLDEQALSQRYTNLVNQVNQKRLPIEQQYGQDTQGAYINKLLGQKQIEGNLSRMGLSSSGFGLTQQAQNETGYGQNLNALMLNRNNQLTGINNEVTNIEGQRLTDFLGLQSQYAGRIGELNQYIAKSVDEKYNQEYNNYMKAKEYEEMLKQQAWENDYKNRALKASSSGGGGSFGGGGFTYNTPEIDEISEYDKRSIIDTANGFIRVLDKNAALIPYDTPMTAQEITDRLNYARNLLAGNNQTTNTTQSKVTQPAAKVDTTGPTKQNATNTVHPLAQIEQNLKNSVTSASSKVIKQVSTPAIKLSRNAQTAIKMLPKNITATELRKILDKDVKYGRYTKKEADAIFNSFR